MTLTLGTGPPPRIELPADSWLQRLIEFRSRILGVIKALDFSDADVPMLSSVSADLDARRLAFGAIYSREFDEASKLASMLTQAGERSTRHELEVRAALAAGREIPSLSDVSLVGTIIAEAKAGLNARYPEVEEAGRAYVLAAEVGAASRALLLRFRREPERLEAERILSEIREIDARVDVGRKHFDADALRIGFEAEGLL